MKKLALVLLILFPIVLQAQSTYPVGFSNGGPISATNANCVPAACIGISIPTPAASTITVQISGTFSGTIAIEKSQDGGVTFTNIASVASTGLNSYSIAGFTQVRARASAWTSGLANINFQISTAASSGGGTNGSISNVPAAGMINPASAPYNAKFNAGTSNTCTTTNANNVVTCPNALFVTGKVGTITPPAVVGQIIFANDATSGVGGVDTCLDNPDILFGGARQTTISSVDSDTQVHVTGNSGTTSTAHACVAWGDDDTTAINAAWAAGGCISSQLLPVGKALISAPIWQAIAGCPAVANSGTGYQGQRVWGAGVTNTYIIPVPLFNFSSIAGGGSLTCGNNCTAAIGNKNISDYEDFNVWGMGERCSATQASTTLWIVGNATRAINTNGIGWCGQGGGTSLTGYNIAGPTDIYTWGGSNFFGSIEMNFQGASVYFGNSFVSGQGSSINGISPMIVQSGSTVSSISNAFSVALQIGVAGGSGTVWNSMNTTQNSLINESACIFIGQGATANFLSNDILCGIPPSNVKGISFFSSGGLVNATNSSFSSQGTGFNVDFGTSAGTFRNGLGNTFAGGAGVFTGTGSFIQGTISPITFAGLGTPANGSVLYCSDCTIANPCAGAGTGALAKRLNGVWVCN
jgi:hypothetical protein